MTRRDEDMGCTYQTEAHSALDPILSKLRIPEIFHEPFNRKQTSYTAPVYFTSSSLYHSRSPKKTDRDHLEAADRSMLLTSAFSLLPSPFSLLTSHFSHLESFLPTLLQQATQHHASSKLGRTQVPSCVPSGENSYIKTDTPLPILKFVPPPIESPILSRLASPSLRAATHDQSRSSTLSLQHGSDRYVLFADRLRLGMFTPSFPAR